MVNSSGTMLWAAGLITMTLYTLPAAMLCESQGYDCPIEATTYQRSGLHGPNGARICHN